MRKLAVPGATLLALVACQDSTSPRPITVAPTRVNAAQSAPENDYIVTFRDEETDPAGQADALVKAYGGSIKFVYRSALKGFAVANLPDAALDALQRNPRVAAVERDALVTADGSGSQTGATWGLDRIDQRDLPLNSTYAYDDDGSNVTAYIIDTGIRTTHVEFSGRASGGFTAISDGNGTNDCHGHGTHVAGTVGGSTYGVAKKVSLVAVRVLDCGGSGSNSGVIAGVDWVTTNHAANSVANMSLGGGLSSALNTAVANSIKAGVTYAVAAGNSNADACNSSPSSTPTALTVGATGSTDAKASFSNWGTCVDLNAPGVGITSSWNTSDVALASASGTSMASPHVAGAAALYLSGHLGSTPLQVESALKGAATTNHVTGLPNGTPNLLLYTHFGSGSTPPPSGPVAAISKSCNGFVCTFTSTGTSTDPTTYEWSGSTSGTVKDPKTYEVTYGFRQSGSVTLKVTDAVGVAQTSVSVTCNPKKCQ
jgi:subtilisin family serine protease